MCEGSPVTLTVDGSNELNYVWSNGQQGIGLKSISVPAALGVTSYTVTAFNPDGCEYHGTSNNIIIHPSNNQPPEIDGVTTFGGFEITVREGLEAYFEVPTYDNPEEDVTFHWLNMFDGPTYGKFYNEYYNIIHEAGSFSWAPQQTGVYQVQVYAQDLNVCQSLPSIVHTIKINVVCAYCDYEITYNNRFPNSNPLPHLTEAVHFIKAGFNGQVVVGNDEVIFRSPDVYLEDIFGGFISGLHFHTETAPICSTAYCNDCCSSSLAFVNPQSSVPGSFSPNNDGQNDVWYIPDFNSPGCAWNAQSFELSIYNRWGDLLFENNDHEPSNGSQCCRFQSPPSPSSPGYSDMFWDGTIDPAFGVTEPLTDGVYYYVAKIWGCDGYHEFGGGEENNWAGYFEVLGTSENQRLAYESNESAPADEPIQTTSNFQPEINGYPNPTNSIYNLRWQNLNHDEIQSTTYNIYDQIRRIVISGQFAGDH